jgi:hypothetical protein
MQRVNILLASAVPVGAGIQWMHVVEDHIVVPVPALRVELDAEIRLESL